MKHLPVTTVTLAAARGNPRLRERQRESIARIVAAATIAFRFAYWTRKLGAPGFESAAGCRFLGNRSLSPRLTIISNIAEISPLAGSVVPRRPPIFPRGSPNARAIKDNDQRGCARGRVRVCA